MIRELKKDEIRSKEQLRRHYEIEKELASRLRRASSGERRALYAALYNEMHQRIPLNPQLVEKSLPEQRKRFVSRQMKFVKRFLRPEACFLEIGAGDCALSLEAAKYVRQVFAVDVSDEITKDLIWPPNFKLIMSDGQSIPVAEGSITVAYSYQLMEHLHPDDAFEQLQNTFKALAPGGVYICVTPNRLNGPHDISMYFDKLASGLHLKEYTITELSTLFKKAGFSKIDVFGTFKGIYFKIPLRLMMVLECLLETLPDHFLKRITRTRLVAGLLGIKLMGTKSKKGAFKKSLTRLLEERAQGYYPELASFRIRPKSNLISRKHHTSVIYEFDICDDRSKKIKSVIVKQRIYNPLYNNDIVTDTQNEFNNLKFLEQFPGKQCFVPRVLDSVPEDGLLISEKIEGTRLSFHMKKFSKLPFTARKKEILKNYFMKAGHWLSEFHRIDYNGEREQINTAACIKKAEAIVLNFKPFGLTEDLGGRVIEKMKQLEKAASEFTFPVTIKHGDFQPKNILCGKSRITVLDMDCPTREISIYDICNFILGARTFDVNLAYSFWNKELCEELSEDYLRAYFQNGPVPYAAIHFITCLGLLESFENTYKRNFNFVKKAMIRAYFKRLLR